MNRIELEKTTNVLKGVAAMLLMMTEIPEGTYQWSEWVHHNLFRQLEDCIKKLETIADGK